MSALSANAVDLEGELTWFNSVLESRFRSYFGDSGNNGESQPGDPPDLTRSSSPYARLVIDAGIDLPERAGDRLHGEERRRRGGGARHSTTSSASSRPKTTCAAWRTSTSRPRSSTAGCAITRAT